MFLLSPLQNITIAPCPMFLILPAELHYFTEHALCYLIGATIAAGGLGTYGRFHVVAVHMARQGITHTA